MAISFNTVVPALAEAQKILPVTIPVIRILTACLIVEPAFTRYNIGDAERKKWSVKQKQHGNCSSSEHKGKKEIKLSFQSKVSGIKWNLLSSMFGLDFFFLNPCFRVLFSKIGKHELVALWVAVNCISVMT